MIQNFDNAQSNRFLVLIRDAWDSTFSDFAQPCGRDAAINRAVAYLAAIYELAYYKAGGDFQFQRLEGGWVPSD